MSDGLSPHGDNSGAKVRVGDKEFTWRPGAVIAVGRDTACDIVVDDTRVSRRHLLIEAAGDGGWLLRDAGSRNGVYVGGTKIETLSLAGPVAVQLGAADGVSVTIEALLPPQNGDAAQAQLPPARSQDLTRARLGRSVSEFVPEQDVVRIGRESSNDLALTDDPRASRRHAELRRTAGGEWEIRDLGSHNGTFVNGAKVESKRLSGGDLIAVGNHIFVFRDGRLEELSEADDTSLDVVSLGVTAPGGTATLLSEVSFSLPSRSVLAVVGPSGAGKSTLLRALTGSLVPSQGQVSFAGRDLHSSYEEFRSRIGLVPQDDLVHPELTPRSELELAAALRLPPDTTRDDRRARVETVLGELGMTERADLQIAKLSGGQRKRVSVGTELLTQPTLLFLDEPTSGLDPGNEKQVMSVLRQLADGGRVVVVVTHATQSLDLADRVLFMARGGRVAYFGPPAEALDYFAAHGVTGGYADIFRVLDDPGDADWPARFRASAAYRRYVGEVAAQAAVRGAGGRPSARPASPVPPRDQLRVLVQRQTLILRGDRRTLLLLGLQPVAFGLIITFLFSPTSLSTNHGPFAALMLWLLVVSATWLGASGTIREIVKELPIFRRERAVGLSIPAYVGSKFAVFGAITVVQSLVLVVVGLMRQTLPPEDPKKFVPLVLRVGARVDPKEYRGLRPFGVGSVFGSQLFELFVAIALAGLAGVALGLAISALVRKSDQAVFLLPVALVVEMALSLPLLKLQNASPLLQDVSNVASANWGMNAAASTVSLNQVLTPYLWDLSFGQASIQGILTTGQPVTPTPQQFFATLKTDPSWQHTSGTWTGSAVVLVIMMAVLLGVAVYALRRLDIGRQSAVPQRARRLAAAGLGTAAQRG